jgi:ferredoxin
MKTTIYYFSATGNSLKLAREVAARLGDCALASIATAVSDGDGGTLVSASERIGFVFPVFAWGMPRMVSDFVDRIELPNAKYVFAISTCVAIPGNTLGELGTRLRAKGLRLHAGFAVGAGRSSLMKMNRLDKIIIRLNGGRKKPIPGEARMGEMVEAIQALKVVRPEKSSWAANVFGSLLHGPALKAFKSSDAQFAVTDACTGCGTCAKVCPRTNIHLADGRPTFAHDCELCHACIQWCPQFAVRHPGFDANPRQYRNPAVRLADMLRP